MTSQARQRIYQGADGQWFLRVRGDDALGPFNNQADAEAHLAKQMRRWLPRNASGHPRAVKSSRRPFNRRKPAL